MMKGGKIRDISFNYKNTGNRFVKDLLFSFQYFNLYRSRLEELRGRIDPAENFSIKVERIPDVKQGQVVFVTGLIVRSHQSRISNVEKYMIKVKQFEPRQSLGNFSSSDDVFYVEDENGRLKLDLTHLSSAYTELVTGVVIGIKGLIQEDAVLLAQSITYPSASPPRQIPTSSAEYICFISGLEIGHPFFPKPLVHVLIDYFLGAMEDSEDGKPGKIARLIILGDSIFKPLDARTVDRKAVGDNDLKGFQEMSASLKQLDNIAAELAGVFPVDVLPGELDPTNASLPQHPLSPCLFPKASSYLALQSVTNPYEFELDGVSVLCTAGQNINALAQFVPEDKNEIELMELTVKFRHLAPNAPDALQCIPMQEGDPFIVKDLPNLYVVGNLKNYATEVTSEGVRLIAVPKFCNSKSFVLVNRFSLEPELITLHELL